MRLFACLRVSACKHSTGQQSMMDDINENYCETKKFKRLKTDMVMATTFENKRNFSQVSFHRKEGLSAKRGLTSLEQK